MAAVPEIVVRIIHIKGPLQGEIQEFYEERVSVGRHPANQIRYPQDFAIVSRNHADIVREGNRFKIIDHSTNGTYVNGERISERILKNGDVITFADREKGPKLSFLTEVRKPSAKPAARVKPRPAERPLRAEVEGPMEPSGSDLGANRAPVIETVQVPLAIQYGPTLRSYKTLPITMGSGSGCDFRLDHPGIAGQHAQIFFYQDQHWIKDLTGRGGICINGLPIDTQAPLAPDDVISMGEQGPTFRFLGGGRLVEAE